VALSPIDKSFAGSRGGFSKEPLEIVKGTKRVRSVGWAGLKVKKFLLFLPIRWPWKDPDQIVSAGWAQVRFIVLKGT
jgi:hypothetical protein